MPLQEFLLSDALIVIGPYNISGDANEVKVEQKNDMLESTVFGHTEHRFVASTLRELSAEGKGFVQFDDVSVPKAVDYNLFNELNATEKALTIGQTKSDGAYCFLGKGLVADYSPHLKVDALGEFTFKLQGNRNTRGRVALPLVSRTATSGNGTIYQMGALSATQKMVITVHVVAFTGTTLTLNVNSNDTNNTTTPTLRQAFSGITGVTSNFAEVSGAITDTFWYVDWTFTGTSFTALVSFGVR